MLIHADGFQADALARETRNDVIPAKRSARPRLTMRWHLRDGVLLQVWRVAEGIAATR